MAKTTITVSSTDPADGIVLTWPVPGAVFKPGTVLSLVAATAAGEPVPSGTVVEFVANGVVVGTVSKAPYQFRVRLSASAGLKEFEVRRKVLVPPPPPPLEGRSLLGGWRLAEPFARGPIAIDFDRMKLWLGGHSQQNTVVEYDLPAMGTGSDVSAWPRVTPVRTYQPWWGVGYPMGLVWWRGKLWCSPRVFYDTTPPSSLTITAQDGEAITAPLPRQVFAGFIKRGPGQDPYLGGGGYESGQGSSSGPSLATLAGDVKIRYGWPGMPGAHLEFWNQRAPREPNYSAANHTDSWVAWEPRTINGVLEGRWACDVIMGGGLELPEGVTYWPWMGTGDLHYARQRPTFAAQGAEATYAYRYDRTTFQLLGYTKHQHLRQVAGQELGPDGRVYLSELYAWQSGSYLADPVVTVFG